MIQLEAASPSYSTREGEKPNFRLWNQIFALMPSRTCLVGSSPASMTRTGTVRLPTETARSAMDQLVLRPILFGKIMDKELREP